MGSSQKIDEAFLEEHGLGGLPPEVKSSLLASVREEMEWRVGHLLSDGMPDSLLAEFQSLVDRDERAVIEWIEANAPDFESDEIYQRYLRVLPADTPPIEVLASYASMVWLKIHRPDYQATVAEVVRELQEQLIARGQEILDSL